MKNETFRQLKIQNGMGQDRQAKRVYVEREREENLGNHGRGN